METVTVNVGRVIRVGRGWADVTIDHNSDNGWFL